MDADFTPYLQLSEQSQPSGTPVVSLELKAPETLFLESPFGLEVVLRRIDNDPHPCIFYWPPDIAACFVLFRYTFHGLERAEVAERRSEAPDVLYVSGWRQYLFELQPSGSSRYLESLHSYRRALRPGERYELLWPGAKTCIWDWGDIQDHLDMELKRREPCLFIVGGSHTSFTVEEGERTFPSPEPSPPGEPLSRVACHLSSCKGPEDSTPITFHTVNLLSGNLQRRRGQDWEFFESEKMPYQIYDDPDIEVTPGQHPNFISLQPGGRWTRMDNLELPSDTEVGEVFKYEFNDRVLDWWDWGTKEDHLQITVKLPCWINSDVLEPKDNEGRPAIVIPASNVVEFTIV
ncbi:hypothetical protein BDV33DRAFT_198972 [Aspergillus novoparasiticus]|uniref:Uncharacterized protein n=1 Tax=Aspergillus novoparasiticus TaxID=986946 RepID=A0A5N6F8G8_9EURO|nr:hypothetical protein BDV33DRAFT_198972 [Aspergillus novoparasiticus]